MFVLIILSFFIAPIIRAKLNHQFMLGARNQAFLTEYVTSMETVKSLQMEPQLKQTFGNYLSTYLNASFDSRKLSIIYNTAANTSLIKQSTTTNARYSLCRCMASHA